MQTQSGSRFLNILIAICFSVILSTSLSSQAYAQSDTEVILTAEAGFGGYAKEGKWIPVHLTVENKGADINGASLQVSYKDFNGIASVFSADISLPTNSRKELFIYAYYPQGGAANLSVELISDKKVVTKTKARISNIAPQSLMIGLMSNTPSAFAGLTQITPQNGITRLVEIQPANLPDKIQGWETLDVIIVSDIDSGELSAAQVRALELWIAKGGILITMGGPKWQATVQGIKDLLPIQVSGTTSLTALPDISAFNSALNFSESDAFVEGTITVLATGKLTEGARVLATQGEFPLVIEKALGKGKSIFFAADPTLSPYKDWDGIHVIYDALLNFRHPQAAWVNGRWDIYGANEAITTIAELAIPSVLLICGLLVVYIVMIGPVNYIFLRIIKKREWAWATIPAIVVIITAISYVYGYFYRGTTPSLNRLTVIQAWDGVSQAENSTLVGIYSPQRDTYTLESENGFLLYPYSLEDINLKSNTSWLSVQSGQHVNAPEIPIEIGGMKVIGTSGTSNPLVLEHDLTIIFDKGTTRISGTVTNKSAVSLNDVNLVTPAQWKVIGDLIPGQSKQINMPISTTANSPEFFFDGSIAVLQTSYASLQVDEEERRKEAFLRSVITTELGESNSNWGIYLMGWVDENQPSATLKDMASKNTDTTLYIHQISPSVATPSTEYKLTTALFEWQSTSDETSPYYTYSYSIGEFELRFRPAIPIKFSGVQQLQLNMDSFTLPTAVEISLWDFTLNDWVLMQNVNWGTFNVPDPERYVNNLGEVTLRIKDAQNQSYIEMKKSTISMVLLP